MLQVEEHAHTMSCLQTRKTKQNIMTNQYNSNCYGGLETFIHHIDAVAECLKALDFLIRVYILVVTVIGCAISTHARTVIFDKYKSQHVKNALRNSNLQLSFDKTCI